MNPYSAEERLQAMLSACYAAVQEHFSHLPLRYIVKPPHGHFDAALARQCAIHIAATQFHIPRKRLSRLQGRQRTSISFAMQRVDRRRREPLFAAAHDRMGARAVTLFLNALHEAAGRPAEVA